MLDFIAVVLFCRSGVGSLVVGVTVGGVRLPYADMRVWGEDMR